MLYPSRSPMAVPKQKQSHSRTNKRRVAAQARRADVQRVPAVPQPAPPAPRLPDVRDLRGPRGRARARPRSRPRARPPDHWVASRMPVTVAVDANGADLGPAEVAAGAAIAAAAGRARRALRARRADRRRAPTASRSSTRPVSIAKAPDPVARGALDARRLDRAGRARRSPRATRDALVSGGSTGAALAAGLFNIKRAAGIYRPALAIPMPVPGAPGDAGRRRRQRRGAAPSTSSSSRFMGAALAQAVLGRRAPARRRCCPTARRRPRARRSSSRRTRCCATAWPSAAPATSSATSRARGDRRRGRRRRHRRLHRQRRAEADRGRLADDAAARSATRAMSSPRGRRPAACCCARRCAACATRSTPRARAAPTCWACAGSASCPHGRFTRYGISQAILLAARAVRAATSSAARTPRWRPPGRCARAPAVRIARYRCLAMTREEVFTPDPGAPGRRARPRSRAHRRGDALQGGPRGRLAGPLHARAGARGLLRRQDVRRAGGEDPDRGPGRRLRPRARARPPPEPLDSSATLLDELPEDLHGRSSRTPRGPSGARTPTRAWPSWATACSAWRSPRTCTRAWRPSASAPGG